MRCRAAQELDLLEEDASVFKLIGPVLVKQELVEVKNNVTKRVEFIKSDMCARAQPSRASALPAARVIRTARASHRPLTVAGSAPCTLRSKRLEGKVKSFEAQGETVKSNIAALQKQAQQGGQ